ncbi:MAG: NADPH-dependent glutamate synthase [Armatimonadetes bacterium]|nr:NADPH-dependent glutamate synthase [Armatimonadota bacterium]NIO74890.1 NADPH-dependent glutamate synthase [Armatimonadota bacterium]NIO95651.1 NADPH-dependent glutamate synthase [Armatimonadota bacterium]
MAERKQRVEMPRRDPEKRARDFEEVALGYNEEQARTEASRCLGCKNRPCVAGCPVGIDIPGFVAKTAAGDYSGAIQLIKQYNALPAICGRVCPQETQCEKVCVLGKKGSPVAIGALERFASDWEASHLPPPSMQEKPSPPGAQRVAVIGSGPASLTAAGELARMGYEVTVFESLHSPGGVLRYGIPSFRMPRDVLEREIDYVRSLGVEIKINVVVGKTLTLEDLFNEGYEAIFVGVGAGLPYFMDIPGENYSGVYSANEFLTRVNLMQAHLFPKYDTPVAVGERVLVIGGGNVTLDSARSALRLGAKTVTVVYRRSRREMPARAEEIENGEEEGIRFRFLAAPKQILADGQGRVNAMECWEMKLGEPDESGRRRPLPVKGREFILRADSVIVAIGAAPNPLLSRATPSLETEPDGRFRVDPETLQTSMPGVFAGGDIANEEGTVIAAMGDAKRAARAIDAYLKEKREKATATASHKEERN